MSKQSPQPSARTEGSPQAERLFPLESEYLRCVEALCRAGVLTLLPESESLGVFGIDGREYPAPTREEAAELLARNSELAGRKIGQGFDRLELTPLAAPAPFLRDRLKAAILRHEAEGKIFRTRRSPAEPPVPVRVNSEKQVWIWKTLREKLDRGELVYFPEEYSRQHRGRTKLEAVGDRRICGFPGWSVGLAERLPVMPKPGRGRTLGGRRQLEIGASPREYLQRLREPACRGETGKTVEDFMTGFLTRLETIDEVSNDVDDGNALWCLGQYLEVSYAELVPTGRWFREVGRVRLDAHRPGNKRCTRSWGASTVVRLPGGGW